MSVYNDKFRKARRDCSPYLFHFVNGDDNDPMGTMYTILKELKLKSKNEYICFSASPLTSIGRFFETNVNRTGKPMYQPFGIGFSRDVLVRDFGARNVIYYDDSESNLIPENLKWRALRLNVDSYDFEYLREWRIKGGEFDFSKFPKEHVIVIAPNLQKLNDLVIVHDYEFRPIIDYVNGSITPDFEEVFKREWKGFTVDSAEDFIDDFAISGSTATQIIGQDMLDKLLESVPLYLSSPKQNPA